MLLRNILLRPGNGQGLRAAAAGGVTGPVSNPSLQQQQQLRSLQPMRGFAEFTSSNPAEAVREPAVDPNEPRPYSGILPDETLPIGRVAPSFRDYQEIPPSELDTLTPEEQERRALDLIQMTVEPARGLLLTDLEEFPEIQDLPSYLGSLPSEAYETVLDLAQVEDLDPVDENAIRLWVRFLPNQEDEKTIGSIPRLDEDDRNLLRMEFLHQAVKNAGKFYAYRDDFLSRAELLETSYFNVFGHNMDQAEEMQVDRLVHPLESEI